MKLLQTLTAQGTATVENTKSVITAGENRTQSKSVRFFLNVSAIGGTPTLDVSIVASVDGIDHVLGSFTQATGVTSESIVIADCPPRIKVVSVVAGTTPSITSTVYAQE